MRRILMTATMMSLLLFSCNDDNDNFDDNQPDPNTGWVEYIEATSAYSFSYDCTDFDEEEGVEESTVTIDVSLEVPRYQNGFELYYDLVPVEGMDPNLITDASGVLDITSDSDRRVKQIEFSFRPGLEYSNAENMAVSSVFDVVLTGTSVPGVGIGIEGTDRLIAHRVSVTLYPPKTDESFLGDYTITNASVLNSALGVDAFTVGEVVTIEEGSNGPLSRQFDTAVFSSFSPTEGTIEFSLDYELQTMTVPELQIISPLTCNQSLGVPIGFGGAPQQDFPCNDNVFTLNMEMAQSPFDGFCWIDFNDDGVVDDNETSNFPITLTLEKN